MGRITDIINPTRPYLGLRVSRTNINFADWQLKTVMTVVMPVSL